MNKRQWLVYGIVLLLIPLWIYRTHSIYQESGLFWWVGTDFAQYHAHAKALWSDDPSNIYRPATYTADYQELQRGFIKNHQPAVPTSTPYPPIFALMFTPFTLLPPLAGFLAWEGLIFLAAVYLAWRAAQFFTGPTRSLVFLLVLTSYPVMETLLVSQFQIFMAVAAAECFLALRRQNDFAAGLWLSCLLVKPQYGLFIGLFLLWTRRWRAVTGVMAGGVAVVGISLLAGGWDAFMAFPLAIGEMTRFVGYWEEYMINWRSLIVAFRPGVTAWKGLLLAQFLGACTLLAVMLVSRARKLTSNTLFSVQFTLVMIATLLVSHHSFDYGAVMIIVPLAAVFHDGMASNWTRLSILPPFFLANLSFVLFVNLPLTARILTFGLLSCFASLFVTAWKLQQETGKRPILQDQASIA